MNLNINYKQALVFLSILIPSFHGVYANQNAKTTPQFGSGAVRLIEKIILPRYTTCEIFNLPREIHTQIKKKDKLFFSYGLKDEAWENQNSLYHFSVWLKRKDSPPHKIFYVVLDPFKNEKKRGWNNAEIDLSSYAGQEVILSYEGQETDHSFNEIKNNNNLLLWGSERIGDFSRMKNDLNIILISLDTLRADRLGINGYFRNTSPHLDNWASNGVNFTEAISQAPWTRPAHMSVFTGLHPSHVQVQPKKSVNMSKFRDDIPTLAEVLRDAGYRTYALNGSGQVAPHFGFFRGFDHYIDSRSANWNKDAKFVFENGINWIRRNSGKKFFLFLHTYEIHHPYIHEYFVKGLTNPSETELLNAKYDSGIFYTDQFIKKLRDALNELELANNTLVVIFSDHGEDLNTHYKDSYHGHTLYDELVRVPLIFIGPNWIKPRSIKNYQARLVDIMPTVLDSIGLKKANLNFQGISLYQFLRGNPLPADSIAISETPNNGPDRKSIRIVKEKEKYKYILTTSFKNKNINKNSSQQVSRDVKKFKGKEFYDLTADPLETKNIFVDSSSNVLRLETDLLEYIRTIPSLSSKNEIKSDPELEEQLKSLGY